MLTDEQIRQLWANGTDTSQAPAHIDVDDWQTMVRDLILSHIEVQAEVDRMKYEIEWREHEIQHLLGNEIICPTKDRMTWTPAQWLEAKRKEILGE